MRSAFFVSGFLLFLFSIISAQDTAEDARRRMSERTTGNNGTIVTPNPPRPAPIVSYVTYLSKEREWSDAKGRQMSGRLVAFSAPEPGKTGPVIVIHEGKVRLRRTGANVSSDLPLVQLSQGDQLFIKAIEAGLRKATAAEEKDD